MLTTKAEENMRSRVRAGITRLEEELGPDFQINTDTLNIASVQQCALGQTFGLYSRGLHQLGIDSDDAVNFGFHAPSFSHYAELTRLWKEELLARST